jgi:RNA polymerase sigma factor (TIGR02999 family)
LLPPDPKTITRLLHEARAGEAEAVSSLLPLVYTELQSLAQALFANERKGHTLQPTALIHEAWLKLAPNLDGVEDRRHFFAIASRAMRQVLTDHARTAKRQKRGEGKRCVTLDEQLVGANKTALDLIDLEDSLERLAALNERHAHMVELRVFGGLTIPETAETLGVSHATVERDWFTVRAWLRRELSHAG